ncbi:high-potential iron-sulfur protein [Novosphingobium sp. ST904]|uniref:high-potential iron-sulfur protein n=1 Tax=Novosphingobium sp. ST904 TaxID=1684385 RepID=UPI0006CCCB05|nr:high-potential iron-sulfur protein [Novosphingobium sp. ST904]KPH63648.1 hypothetical protein ADT71_12715 [Novosphingobium sp. ST904]TCM36061.1 high potential iron-sulfur protein [Novosphingobium sp. ST904]
MTPSRREFLGRALTFASLAAAGLVASGGALAQPPAGSCYDPAALPFSQKSRRRALGYLDASADPARRCGSCAFFTAAAPGCGTCQMLSGGPVNAGAVCNSFAPKAAK